ncbi:acetate--CoA ligase family protein [Mesorhizobium xinjiangense]|uniref:acetate--CoA ligase family protein n=1 Tax=Mesorhizobium xinjiangense TaxID=2678685 RepID=UPI0012ECFED5|nr:acetate--CoA ligase family protein [Mesorhizobium xinjiangense]
MSHERMISGLDAVFSPRSIAIVGASTDPTKTGGRPVHLLIKHGFAGAIYPVNPKATEVQGLAAYARLDALPEVPDLVLVAVPGAAAVATLETAAALGVGAAIVLSAGFTEAGPEGIALQARVTEIAHDSGMRIVGPNCLGTVSIRSRAIGTFSIALEQEMPLDGGISIVSQSGNVGSSALRMLGDCGAGAARFIATGNEADVQIADAIGWMANDSETSVILCCMETCRDGARLTGALELAAKAGKPVIALKIGTSEAGQKAALSHTGGLAGSDQVFDAVFARYGVVRVRSLEELVEVGAAAEAVGQRCVGTPPSATMIAASGGFGVMMADAASAHGISVNPLGEGAQARIRALLPLAATANPVDATAQMSASPDILETLVDAVLEDDANTTACLMLALGMGIPRLRRVFTEALAKVSARHPDKTLVACLAGPADAIADLRALGIACFPTIDSAMRGLAALGQIELFRAQPPIAITAEPPQPLNPAVCRNEATAKAALSAAGLSFVPELTVTNAEQAFAAAEKFGVPVAMKILSPDIQHKSDIGGVALNVRGGAEAKAAFTRLTAAAALNAPSARVDGVLVSPMTTGGTELILGTLADPVFGPVVMVGLGGIFAEIFEDTALRLAPVSEVEAHAMLRELRAFPLLDGARGRAPTDLDAAAAAVAALSRFAARHVADIGEIDINPMLVRARGQGAVALDALLLPTRTDHPEGDQ